MRYIIRHGYARYLGEFEPVDGMEYRRTQRVVIESPRGTEAGTILCASAERTKSFLHEPTAGKILRLLNDQDVAQEKRLLLQQGIEYDACRKFIVNLRLQMDLVDVEHLLGGERIVFYFLVRP